MTAEQWYCRVDGMVAGPLGDDEIRSLFTAGHRTIEKFSRSGSRAVWEAVAPPPVPPVVESPPCAIIMLEILAKVPLLSTAPEPPAVVAAQLAPRSRSMRGKALVAITAIAACAMLFVAGRAIVIRSSMAQKSDANTAESPVAAADEASADPAPVVVRLPAVARPQFAGAAVTADRPRRLAALVPIRLTVLPAPRAAAVPQLAAGPVPLPDHAARQAERWNKLLAQRANLLAAREHKTFEKLRYEKSIAQNNLDLKALGEKADAAMFEIDSALNEIDDIRSARDRILIDYTPNGVDILVNTPEGYVKEPNITREQLPPPWVIKNQLEALDQVVFRYRLELQRLQAEAARIAVTQQSLAKSLEPMNAQLADIVKQAAFLRAEWLRTCDVFGRQTRAEHEASIPIFDAAEKADPSNHGVRLARAVARMHLGQVDDALADLNIADDKTNPFQHECRALRGYLKAMTGDDRRGLAELGRAVAADKTLVMACLLRGSALAHLDRRAAAAADFKVALNRDPSDVDARCRSALFLSTQPPGPPRKTGEALTDAEYAVQKTRRNDWRALLALAAAQADAGRYAEAAATAGEAAELTQDERRDVCLTHQRRYVAEQPPLVTWSVDGR